MWHGFLVSGGFIIKYCRSKTSVYEVVFRYAAVKQGVEETGRFNG